MERNKIKKKTCFPYTYGDEVTNDNNRLSDYVVKVCENERFQNYVYGVLTSVYFLGSNMAPANAVPADAGQGIVDVTAGAVDPNNVVPTAVNNANLGHASGNMGNADLAARAAADVVNKPPTGPQNPLPNHSDGPRLNQPNYGWNYDRRMSPPPGHSHFHIPGPPRTTVGKSLNTAGIALGVTLICLNGYWGNPMYATLCAGIVFDLAQNLVKKTIMK